MPAAIVTRVLRATLLLATLLPMPAAAVPAPGSAIFAWTPADQPLDLLSDDERPHRLVIEGRSWLGLDKALELRGGRAVIDEAAVTTLAERAVARHALTIAVVATARSDRGVGPLMTLADAAGKPVVGIVQDGAQWRLAGVTGGDGRLGAVRPGRRQLLVATLDGGAAKLHGWCDDGPAVTCPAPAPLATPACGWVGAHDDGSGWEGAIEEISFDAVVADDVGARARHAAIAAAARPAPPRLVVEARLVSRQGRMSPDYPRVLIGCTYEVVRVVDGVYTKPRLQVFHWGKLDNRPVQEVVGMPIGTVRRLELYPLDAERFPMLLNVERSDHADYDLELPDYFGPGF